MYVSRWYKDALVLYGLEPSAECVATVCLADISAPFSNYFVSQFASQDLWHISEFSMQCRLFIAALAFAIP